MHFLAAAVLVWTMTQLVQSWLQLRLVAAMCFGLLLVYVANGAIYRLVDVPDNIKYWNDHKDEELKKRNWLPGSFQAIQFENKIINGEMVGFNASPNTFAAVVVMLGVVCLGVVIQRLVDKDEPAWPLLVILGLGGAIWIGHYTHSKAALVTPLVAGAILGAIALFGSAVARWRTPLYFAGTVGFVLAGLGIALVGITQGNMLASSMTFRWHYWLGAAKVLERHPILGIGWANFGMHYVGVRLPVASEEVKDPHNLIVRAFVELGILGGVLMLAWLARVWWELTAKHSLPLKWQAQPAIEGDPLTFKSFCMISVLAMLLNTLASVDFLSPTPDAGWFIVLQLMKRGLFLGLLLLGYAAVALRSSRQALLDDRPAPWVMYSIIVAIAVFLLHNLIDFSLFEPGAMGVFTALLGTALGIRTELPRTTSTRPRAVIALAGATGLWFIALIGIVVPVALAETTAQNGDDALRDRRARAAAMQYRKASDLLWISNSDYPYRAAMALTRAGADAKEVRSLLDLAIETNPMNAPYYRTRAEVELASPNADANRVKQDFEKVISLDPNDVSAHLDFADALVRLGLPQHAREQYQEALRYNDLLDPNEPKRLPQGTIDQIRQKISASGG
jgi:O-antigen ligase/tetratricopeptide (TPR) repeat protein